MEQDFNLAEFLLKQHDIREKGFDGKSVLPPWAVNAIKDWQHIQFLKRNAHLLFKCKNTGRIFGVFSPELKFVLNEHRVSYYWLTHDVRDGQVRGYLRNYLTMIGEPHKT